MNICISIYWCVCQAEITSKLRNFSTYNFCVDTIHSVFSHFFPFSDIVDVVAFASREHMIIVDRKAVKCRGKYTHTFKSLQIYSGCSMYWSQFCMCARTFFSSLLLVCWFIWFCFYFIFPVRCCYCTICVWSEKESHVSTIESAVIAQKKQQLKLVWLVCFV